jgi:hypothetical protein
MRKNRKLIILFLILIIISVGLLSLKNKSNNTSFQIRKTTETQNTNNTSLATLEVQDKKYQQEIEKEDSVYDLMEKIKNNPDNNFTFKVKNYPALGYFVDEINGVRGKPGAYWIYYVNDKEASVGISNYIIKSGDIIRWVKK